MYLSVTQQSRVSVLSWWVIFLHLAIQGSRLLQIIQSITPQRYVILCFQPVLGKLKKAHLLFKIPWQRKGSFIFTCELHLGAIGYTLPSQGQAWLLLPIGKCIPRKGGKHSGRCLAVSVTIDCCLLCLPGHGSICHRITWWSAAGHVQLQGKIDHLTCSSWGTSWLCIIYDSVDGHLISTRANCQAINYSQKSNYLLKLAALCNTILEDKYYWGLSQPLWFPTENLGEFVSAELGWRIRIRMECQLSLQFGPDTFLLLLWAHSDFWGTQSGAQSNIRFTVFKIPKGHIFLNVEEPEVQNFLSFFSLNQQLFWSVIYMP